jgi:bacillithiol biosynthesis cysteine-adding enzyme BshC
MEAITVPYEKTGYFSQIVIDYLNQHDKLKPFYEHQPTIEGIREAINARADFSNENRQVLIEELKKQYVTIELTEKESINIDLLLKTNCFTITTAHQPNIFTGPLYFLYKILHAIKLSDYLATQFPENHFVPVYYMGSEDADLDEIGQFYLGGEQLKWETNQTGPVGKMLVDSEFLVLIERVHGQIATTGAGNQLSSLFKQAYQLGRNIQECTLHLVHQLFGAYGLVVVIPDNGRLKKLFEPVIIREVKEQFSHKAVVETIKALQTTGYSVQAAGRKINLFYIFNNQRLRIDFEQDKYFTVYFNKEWNEAKLIEEIQSFPERFSCNVILRGAFQETILPNIAFIGGGGELAYWLELKNVFAAANIPFPVLVLRNSFLFITKKDKQLINKLKLNTTDFFKDSVELLNNYIKEHSKQQLSLKAEKAELELLYTKVLHAANAIDPSFNMHVLALTKKSIQKLEALEKKMLRREKRKYAEVQQQIEKLKTSLFPKRSLQERIDNIGDNYSKLGGHDMLDTLLKFSKSGFIEEQGFTVLLEQE